MVATTTSTAKAKRLIAAASSVGHPSRMEASDRGGRLAFDELYAGYVEACGELRIIAGRCDHHGNYRRRVRHIRIAPFASSRATRYPRPAPAAGWHQSGPGSPRRAGGERPRLACGQIAQHRSHSRCLLHQWPVGDRQVAADHAPVAVDWAVRETVDLVGERPGSGRWRVPCGNSRL